jgi:hypothetical protein
MGIIGRQPSIQEWMVCVWLAGMVLAGCASKPQVVNFDVMEVATDKSYGYSQHHPIKVGGVAEGRAADHRDHYFKSLRGPKGQPISYISNGTCCQFDTKDGKTSTGQLEVFLVTYKGIGQPVILYLDAYTFESPKAPMGFSLTSVPHSKNP